MTHFISPGNLQLGECVVRDVDGQRQGQWVSFLCNGSRLSPMGGMTMERQVGFVSNIAAVLDRLYNYEDFGVNVNVSVEAGAPMNDTANDTALDGLPAQFEVHTSIARYIPNEPAADTGFDCPTLLKACEVLKPGTAMMMAGRDKSEVIQGVAFGVLGPIGVAFRSNPDFWRGVSDIGTFIATTKLRRSYRFNGLRNVAQLAVGARA